MKIEKLEKRLWALANAYEGMTSLENYLGRANYAPIKAVLKEMADEIQSEIKDLRFDQEHLLPHEINPLHKGEEFKL